MGGNRSVLVSFAVVSAVLLEYLEEILVVRRVRFTLRQQRGNCLKPEGLSFEPLLKQASVKRMRRNT